MGDAFALCAISCGALLIRCELRESEQPTSDECSRRSIAIAVQYAFISEVVPGHAVLRKLGNRKVGNLLRSGKRAGIFGFGISHGESIKSPSCTARPWSVGRKSLVSMEKDPLTRRSVVGKVELRVAARPATVKLEALSVVTG